MSDEQHEILRAGDYFIAVEGLAMIRNAITNPPLARKRMEDVRRIIEHYDEFLTKLVPGMDVAQYLDGVKPVTQQGMADTLANLKAVAESAS